MKDKFTERVYKEVKKIPKGKVATYGQIATLSGNKTAARAVGMCMRNNKDTALIPCHRVVGSTGALVGYAYGNGVSTKEALLRAEGVVFSGKRVDLAKSKWLGK